MKFSLQLNILPPIKYHMVILTVKRINFVTFTVGRTIRRSIRDKTFGPNFLTKTWLEFRALDRATNDSSYSETVKIFLVHYKFYHMDVNELQKLHSYTKNSGSFLICAIEIFVSDWIPCSTSTTISYYLHWTRKQLVLSIVGIFK